MDDIESIYDDALTSFREKNSRFLGEFTNATANVVKWNIIKMQSDQESRNALKDLSRLRDAVDALEKFQEVAELDVEKTEYIWGPLKSVLNRAYENEGILDNLLQTYLKLGKHLPVVSEFRFLVASDPATRKCMAYMYHDLLSFQSDILKLFSNPPNVWKQTFACIWTDRQGDFDHILTDFMGNSRILKSLYAAHQAQRNNEFTRQSNNNWRHNQDVQIRLENGQDRIEGQLRGQHQMLNDMAMHMNNRERVSQDEHGEIQADISEIAELIRGSNQRADQMHTRFDGFLEKYEEDRERNRIRHEEQAREKTKKQLEEALIWVNRSSTKVQDDFHEYLQKTCETHPDTTEWILDLDEVDDWIRGDDASNPILWINGAQGFGKTTLASKIIEECRGVEEFNTCYFYCRSDNDVSRQDICLDMYVYLLRQMMTQNEELLPYFCDKKSRSGTAVLQNEGEARSLVDICCEANRKHFIIIDGLDECGKDHITATLRFFRQLVRKCDQDEAGKLRVLFISRKVTEMEKLLDLETAAIFSIDANHNRAAIRTYLEKKTEELREKFDLTTELKQEVLDLTLERAGGMFLFAALIMRSLWDQSCLENLKKALSKNKFPKKLDDVYKNIVDRLEQDLGEEKWATAKDVLGWLVCVKRPLNLHEFYAAFAIVVENDVTTGVELKDRAFVDDISELGGCLVQVLGNRIVFSHATARKWIKGSERWDVKYLECDRAITCISYLSAEWFDLDLQETDRKSCFRHGFYAFLDYAASRWIQHLETVITTGGDLLEDESKWLLYQDKIGNTLKRFVEIHREDLILPDEVDAAGIMASAQQKCSCFHGQPFYDDLILIWAHVLANRNGKCKEISIKRLRESVAKIRTQIEEVAVAGGEVNKVYGDLLFKCSRIMCDFFHMGFDNKAQRDKHHNRHERPFECDEPDCSIVPFGFSTNKDKEKHMKAYHSDSVMNTTTTTGEPGFVEPARQLTNARFPCTICTRSFTRNANLVAHQRNHSGLRPFECSHCDRAFTRNYDRRRHERTRHTRRSANNNRA